MSQDRTTESSGQERQGSNVPWSNHTEVSVIKGGDPCLLQPLSERDHAGVHDSDPKVVVLLLDRAATFQVIRVGWLATVNAREDIVEKP